MPDARPTFALVRLRLLYARSTPVVRNAKGQHVSARSRSGDPACSAAASAWRTGKATAATYKQLAACRAMAASKHAAHLHRIAGNETMAQVHEHRAAVGKAGPSHRHALAEYAGLLRAGKAADRAVRKGPAPAPRKVTLKGLSPTQKAASEAIGSALHTRSHAEAMNREPLTVEQKTTHFQIAERRRKEAQPALKAARREQAKDKLTGAPLVKGNAPPVEHGRAAAGVSQATLNKSPAPAPTKHTADSIRRQAAAEAKADSGPDSRPGDLDVRRGHFESALAVKHARDLPEDDFVRLMGGEGRRDMARGNAVRLMQSVAGMKKADAEQALGAVAASRQGSARFARPTGQYETPSAGITKNFDYLPAQDVYRAAHRAATGAAPKAPAASKPDVFSGMAAHRAARERAAPAGFGGHASGNDPYVFANRVRSVAAGVGPEGRFGGDKVFISHAHAAYEAAHGPIPISIFKSRLAAANQARHLNLSRADLVEAMDPAKVQASEIPFGRDKNGHGGGAFHFIRDDVNPPAPAAPMPRIGPGFRHTPGRKLR